MMMYVIFPSGFSQGFRERTNWEKQDFDSLRFEFMHEIRRKCVFLWILSVIYGRNASCVDRVFYGVSHRSQSKSSFVKFT